MSKQAQKFTHFRDVKANQNYRYLKYARQIQDYLLYLTSEINLRTCIIFNGCKKCLKLKKNFDILCKKNEARRILLVLLILGITSTYQCMLDNALNAHATYFRLIKVRELRGYNEQRSFLKNTRCAITRLKIDTCI